MVEPRVVFVMVMLSGDVTPADILKVPFPGRAIWADEPRLTVVAPAAVVRGTEEVREEPVSWTVLTATVPEVTMFPVELIEPTAAAPVTTAAPVCTAPVVLIKPEPASMLREEIAPETEAPPVDTVMLPSANDPVVLTMRE